MWLQRYVCMNSNLSIYLLSVFTPDVKVEATAPPPPSSPPPPTPVVQSEPKTPVPQLTQDKVEPIVGMRKAMSKAMLRANQIPHFGYDDEASIQFSFVFCIWRS